jgi:hypothetical protein
MTWVTSVLQVLHPAFTGRYLLGHVHRLDL